MPHTFCYLLVCTFYGIIRGDKNCSYEYILHHLAQQSYVTSSVIAHYTTSCSNSEQLRQLYCLLYTTVAVCLYNSCLPRNHSTVIQTGKRGGGCLYTFIRIYNIHTYLLWFRPCSQALSMHFFGKMKRLIQRPVTTDNS